MSENGRLATFTGSNTSVRAHLSGSGQVYGEDRGAGSYDSTPIAFPVAQVMDEVEALFLRKHADYGPDNIAQSPFGPMQGLLTRLHDKQARAVHLVKKNQDANFESLEDTFIDMIGYSLAAILCLRGNWPGVKKP